MFEQPVMVVPGYPFHRGQLHGLPGSLWCAAIAQLSLVEPVDHLGQRVVVAFTLAFNRESSMPALAKRPLYLMLTYCDPCSE